MIGAKLNEAFNTQIKRELDSAYLYLAMAEYFKAEGYDGMATWMTAQSKEEVDHAMRFIGHVNERAGRVELQAIAKPQFEWDSPLAAFQAAYAHEQEITKHIDDLVQLARDENDKAAEVFLHWFVEEQVEEEDSTLKIVETLKKISDSPQGLILIDRELGQREQ